jgi:hypothetical protein
MSASDVPITGVQGIDHAKWSALVCSLQRPEGIKPNTWYAWRCGRRAPHPLDLPEIFPLLGISEFDLLCALGWDGYPGVTSLLSALELFAAVDKTLRAANAKRKAALRAEAGKPPPRSSLSTDRVKLHRCRLDYVQYCKLMDLPLPCDKYGQPILTELPVSIPKDFNPGMEDLNEELPEVPAWAQRPKKPQERHYFDEET